MKISFVFKRVVDFKVKSVLNLIMLVSGWVKSIVFVKVMMVDIMCYLLICLFSKGIVSNMLIMGFRKLIVVVFDRGMKVVVVNISVMLF